MEQARKTALLVGAGALVAMGSLLPWTTRRRLSSGRSAARVWEALGHSSVAFAADTYQHLMPTMQEQARAIQDALGGVLGK
jgi:hypothetical protein